MPNGTASRVRAYLDDLDRALSDLPKDRRTEIVRDIRGHIDVALAEQDDPSAADVEQLLDELGTPQEIAEAAYAELPPARAKIAGRDIATIVLLLIGGLVLPFVGWFIGVVLLWTSDGLADQGQADRHTARARWAVRAAALAHPSAGWWSRGTRGRAV